MNKDKLVYEINNSNTKNLKLFVFRTLTNKENEKQIPCGRLKKYKFKREIYKNDEINQISKKEINELKTLDIDTLNFCIARLEIIVESFKSIGALSLLFSFVVLFYTIYDNFIHEFFGILGIFFMLFIIFLNIYILNESLKKERLNMLAAIYLKSVLEDIKREKLNSEKISKKKENMARRKKIYYM